MGVPAQAVEDLCKGLVTGVDVDGKLRTNASTLMTSRSTCALREVR